LVPFVAFGLLVFSGGLGIVDFMSAENRRDEFNDFVYSRSEKAEPFFKQPLTQGILPNIDVLARASAILAVVSLFLNDDTAFALIFSLFESLVNPLLAVVVVPTVIPRNLYSLPVVLSLFFVQWNFHLRSPRIVEFWLVNLGILAPASLLAIGASAAPVAALVLFSLFSFRTDSDAFTLCYSLIAVIAVASFLVRFPRSFAAERIKGVCDAVALSVFLGCCASGFVCFSRGLADARGLTPAQIGFGDRICAETDANTSFLLSDNAGLNPVLHVAGRRVFVSDRAMLRWNRIDFGRLSVRRSVLIRNAQNPDAWQDVPVSFVFQRRAADQFDGRRVEWLTLDFETDDYRLWSVSPGRLRGRK
jgi:hypothetical protein